MSAFEGQGLKVRCIDCVSFSNGRCLKKDTKTSAKKRRTCSVYKFSGAYKNRNELESRYIPYEDPNTRRLKRKILKSNLLSATDSNLVVPASDFLYGTTAQRGEVKDKSLIWTPGSQAEEEENG